MFISVVFVKALLVATVLALPNGVASTVNSSTASAVMPLSGAFLNKTSAAAVDNEVTAGVRISGQRVGDFRTVTANFDLPPASSPGGSSSSSFAVPLVGLDFETTCPTFLIAGVQIRAVGDRAVYTPFYQWGAVSAHFSEIQLSANDEVDITLQATSRTAAVVTITKNVNDQTQRVSLSFPDAPLCLGTPGWFVSSIETIPLANFEDIIFDRPTATDGSGATVGPLDPRADVLNIVRGNTRLTEVGRGEQSISVRYAGPE